jgi:hypothetical protein
MMKVRGPSDVAGVKHYNGSVYYVLLKNNYMLGVQQFYLIFNFLKF